MYILAFYVAMIASWLTHVVHCFVNEQWLLLIAGAIAFPVAIINGFFIWFA